MKASTEGWSRLWLVISIIWWIDWIITLAAYQWPWWGGGGAGNWREVSALFAGLLQKLHDDVGFLGMIFILAYAIFTPFLFKWIVQ